MRKVNDAEAMVYDGLRIKESFANILMLMEIKSIKNKFSLMYLN